MNALLIAYLGSIFGAHTCGRRVVLDKGLQDWFEDLVHEDSGVRDAVRDYMVGLGEIGVPCLVELLSDPHEAVRRWAAVTLLAVGKSAVPVLQARFRQEDVRDPQVLWLLRRLRAP